MLKEASEKPYLQLKNDKSWVVLDGIDATGKTTQGHEVAKILQSVYGLRVKNLSEFSQSPIGDLIRLIIERRRFFSLIDDRQTPLSDSILFLSDLCFQAEYEIVNNQNIDFFISDRGIISLLAYQSLRIAKHGSQNIDEILERLFQTYKLLFENLKVPDLHIIYDLNINDVNRRVQERGEAPLSKDDEMFLESARAIIHNTAKQFPHIILIVGGKGIASITEDTVNAILQVLK